MTITIASVNVNGLRAAVKNGMHAWIDERQPDIITLQEVRCPDELVAELMGDGWHVAHAECNQKGRAGVAVASRLPIVSSQIGSDHKVHNFTGRWIQSDIKISQTKTLSVVSAYVHTGDAESLERMTEKYAFFAAMKICFFSRVISMSPIKNLISRIGRATSRVLAFFPKNEPGLMRCLTNMVGSIFCDNMLVMSLAHIHGGRGAVRHLITTPVGESITTLLAPNSPKLQPPHLLIAPRLMTPAGQIMHQ